eukprot:jgi/Ulvmu1/318/UM001_0322.1
MHTIDACVAQAVQLANGSKCLHVNVLSVEEHEQDVSGKQMSTYANICMQVSMVLCSCDEQTWLHGICKGSLLHVCVLMREQTVLHGTSCHACFCLKLMPSRLLARTYEACQPHTVSHSHACLLHWLYAASVSTVAAVLSASHATSDPTQHLMADW